MRLASIQIKLATASLAAKVTARQTTFYALFQSTNKLTSRTAVDRINGELEGTVGFVDGFFIGNVVVVILAGQFNGQGTLGSLETTVIVTVNINVVDAHGRILSIWR